MTEIDIYHQTNDDSEERVEQSALAQGGRDTLFVESFKTIKLTKICLLFVIFNPQKF